jgi:hypothetical protein
MGFYFIVQINQGLACAIFIPKSQGKFIHHKHDKTCVKSTI